ncbi:MAG: N-formylglutamate deformylase, partial [Mesorhizobium sp.]
GYMREPAEKGAPENWPVPYDAAYAAPIRATLKKILETAIAWAAR